MMYARASGDAPKMPARGDPAARREHGLYGALDGRDGCRATNDPGRLAFEAAGIVGEVPAGPWAGRQSGLVG